MSERCALCGRDPATGYAKIGDDRYCHGDDEADPTCYMRGQRLDLEKRHAEYIDRAFVREWLFGLPSESASSRQSEEAEEA